MQQTRIKVIGNKISLNAVFNNFNISEIQKIKKASTLFCECLNSPEFEHFIKNFYWEKTFYSGFWWWKRSHFKGGHSFRLAPMTRIDVYNTIINASETLNGEVDNEIDVSVILDKRRNKRVLGYTYSNTPSQWIYNFFFRNGEVSDIAGNICHEWLHKLGFTHEYKGNPLRAFTVPYAVGYFVRDWIKEKVLNDERYTLDY